MQFEPTPLEGAYVIAPEPFSDHRGLFMRIFCKNELARVGFTREIVQANHSLTRKRGAIRGLHFQRPPKAEAKIVKCIRGAVFDVIVDLRKNSRTFAQWFGLNLSAENFRMLVIPEGFAHGFQVLEPDTELIYLHTEFYSPECEGGVRFDDPRLGVQWPLPPEHLSEKDMGLEWLDESFSGL